MSQGSANKNEAFTDSSVRSTLIDIFQKNNMKYKQSCSTIRYHCFLVFRAKFLCENNTFCGWKWPGKKISIKILPNGNHQLKSPQKAYSITSRDVIWRHNRLHNRFHNELIIAFCQERICVYNKWKYFEGWRCIVLLENNNVT